MKKDILAGVPEMALIQDARLRDQVVAVWEEAITTGGYTVREMTEIPFSPLADADSATYLDHIRAVCRVCVAMADALTTAYGNHITVNRDVLVAGALLADIGKLIEFEKRSDGALRKGHRGEMLRHPFSGVGMAFKHELPYEVMHIIAVHSREGDFVRRSPEAIIYHHAANTDFDLAR